MHDHVQHSGGERRFAWLDLGIAVLLFGVMTAVYLSPDIPEYPNGGDNLWYIPTASSLLRDGDLDLSEYREDLATRVPWEVWITDIDQDPRLLKHRGELHNYFPVGVALVNMPWVALARAIVPGADEMTLPGCNHMARGAAALWAAAAVALLFLVARRLTPGRGVALGVALVFGLATPHLATHASALWSHNVVLPFLLLAWLCLTAVQWAWLAALPLAVAYIVRPDAAITILAALVVLLITDPRRTWRFCLLGGIIAVIFIVWSWQTYGTVLPPYYMASRLSGATLGEAAVGHLVSPNRGLFVFVPVLAFAPLGAILTLRGCTRHRVLFGALAGIVLMHWISVSSFPHWWGGHSYGPRIFCQVLPYWVLLLIPVWDWLHGLPRARSRALAGLAALGVLWGLFVQVRGVTSPHVHAWNAEPEIDRAPERVWSWSDMQILRHAPQ